MKLYVITISDVQDFTDYPLKPVIRLTLKDARKELARLKAAAKEIYQGQYDSCVTGKDSFSLFPGEDWGNSHYDARIDVVEVPNVTKVKVRKFKM